MLQWPTPLTVGAMRRVGGGRKEGSSRATSRLTRLVWGTSNFVNCSFASQSDSGDVAEL